MTASPLFEVVAGTGSIIFFVLGGSILYYGIKKRFTPSLAMACVFFALSATSAFDFFTGLLLFEEMNPALVLMNLANISIIIMALSLVIYSDRISGISISPKTIVGVFLCALSLGMAWREPWDPDYTEANGWVQLWQDDFTLIFLIMLLFAAGNFILIIYSAYREMEDPRQRIIILFVLLGFCIPGGAGGLVVFLDEFFAIQFFPRLDAYLIFLGLVFVGFAQLIDPLALYFVNARIDVCGIASESGVPYVTYVPEGGLFDVSLGTAAIAGVQALIKDVSRAEKSVKSLDSGDKKILFEYCEPASCESRLVAFMISNTETVGLRDALAHILASFEEQYSEHLSDIVDSTLFDPFKSEIERSLSFTISKRKSTDLTSTESLGLFSRLKRMLG
ncbi:MAG: hypothetical protein ACFFBD_19875 [Candidatus Hodarchaeota archaeon]